MTHYLKQQEEDATKGPQQPKDIDEDEQEEIPQRKLEKHIKFKPRGPIGLLLAAMAMNDMQLGLGFEILEQHNPTLKLLEVP